MQKSIYILTWLLALGLNLQGQTSSKKKPVSFKFSCASWDTQKDSELFFLPSPSDKKESVDKTMSRLKTVDVTEMTRSESYQYKGGRRIVFYKKLPSASGKLPLKAVASTSVSADWKKVLFVFFPGEKPGQYKILPIRDDRKHAPYGSYQFVNLSNLNLAGVIDKKRITVKAKGRQLVAFKGDKSKPLNFGVWAEIDGEKQWLQRNTITYNPNKYLIYFFYPTKDARGKLKVKSKGIVDFRPPVVEENAPVEAVPSDAPTR